jgi:uncharacterized membrane protein YedE/YeeE
MGGNTKVNDYFVSLGKKPIYKRLMKEPLTYVAGAVLLGILNTANFAMTGSAWGVTSAFATWGGWLFEAVGGDVSTWNYFLNEKAAKALSSGFFSDGASLRNLGIIFGAMLATLFASEFKIKKPKKVRQVVAAIIGGLLMGYGARLADGCNIGAMFSAISALSLSGWIFAAFLLVGAIIGSKLLIGYFMK